MRQAVDGRISLNLDYLNGHLRHDVELSGPRGGRWTGTFRLRVHLDQIEIGGTVIEPDMRMFLGPTSGTHTATKQTPVTLERGRFEAVARLRLEAVDEASWEVEPLGSWPLELAEFVDVDPDATVTYIDDPSLAPVPWQGHPEQPRATAVEGGARINTTLYFEAVPVATVADVFWRAGGREWKIARVTVRSGYRGGIGLLVMEPLADFDARRVDIILRTVEGEEPDATWPREVWRGEIVIPDVEVRWTGSVPQGN